MFSFIVVHWGNLCKLKYMRLWPRSFVCTSMFWNLLLCLNVALPSCPHTAEVGLLHSGRESKAALKVFLLLSSILPFFCMICAISFNHLFCLPYWSPLLNMYHIHYNIFVLEILHLYISQKLFLGLYVSWILGPVHSQNFCHQGAVPNFGTTSILCVSMVT